MIYLTFENLYDKLNQNYLKEGKTVATKVSTKKPLFGNKRSHALNATKMRQNPNLQT